MFSFQETSFCRFFCCFLSLQMNNIRNKLARFTWRAASFDRHNPVLHQLARSWNINSFKGPMACPSLASRNKPIFLFRNTMGTIIGWKEVFSLFFLYTLLYTCSNRVDNYFNSIYSPKIIEYSCLSTAGYILIYKVFSILSISSVIRLLFRIIFGLST